MNIALALALVTATTNLCTAAIHFVLSRAPGWRSSRALAAIASTAALYSVGNIVFALPEADASVRHWAVRVNYATASAHALLWFPLVLGGPEALWSSVPRGLRWIAGLAGAATAVLLLTGWHLEAGEFSVPIDWAGVEYRYTRTTPLGEAYGLFIVGLLLASFGALVARVRRGERDLVPVVIGFAVFLSFSLVEALVANGVLRSLSPADLGFLAVLVPTSIVLGRRFIADAHKLRELSDRLEHDVRARTAERDHAQDALRESERLAALGRLAAGVGHEINNPLMYMQGALTRLGELAEGTADSATLREALSDARDGAWRIQKVVEGLRSHSQRTEERAALDLRDVARAALRVAQPSLRHEARLELELRDAPLAFGEEPRLVQALVNLLANAVQAVSEHEARGGSVRLATGATAAGEPSLEVTDDGPGIPAAQLASIGEPYFTTRGRLGGLGLGLFTTRSIVEAHGGRLEISPASPRGTTVRIVLPRAPRSAANRRAGPEPSLQADPSAPHSLPARRRGRLLIIDDEALVLRMLARLLESEWEVATAESMQAAREALRRPWDAVLCDLMLLGGSGIQLASEIERSDPDLRRRTIFMTGGAITAEAEAFLARADVCSLQKPMNPAVLRAQLRELGRAGRSDA